MLDSWVVRSGSTLAVVPMASASASASASGGFRFVSFNVPNLHYLEDRPDPATGVRLAPTPFEQDDAIATVAYLRGNVVRIYTLSYQSIPSASSSSNSSAISAPAYHIASSISAFADTKWSPIPNTANPQLFLNEDLFAGLDQAVAIANSRGVRLIIPFIDRWSWWGGIEAFSSLHATAASPSPDFYTDPTVTANFLAVVAAVVNRTNKVTKRRYCEEPAVMAWETGNELQTMANTRAPADWTLAVAKAVRAVLRTASPASLGTSAVTPGSQQLVVDGSFGTLRGWDAAVLSDPDVDMFTGHYYEFGLDGMVAPYVWPIAVTFLLSVVGLAALLVLWLRPQWMLRSLRAKGRSSATTSVRLPIRRDTVGEDSTDSPSSESGLTDQDYQDAFAHGATFSTSFSSSSSSAPLSAAPNPPPPLPTGATTTRPATAPRPQPRRRQQRLRIPAPRTLVTAGVALATAASLILLAVSINSLLRALSSPYAARLARDLVATSPYRKPLFVGEFGLSSVANYRDLLAAVAAAAPTSSGSGGGCVGALAWSLRFRARDGGWYVHDEGGGHWALHDRGAAPRVAAPAAAGFGADETETMGVMRDAAAAVAGVPASALAVVPAPAPVVLAAASSSSAGVGVRWRGSVGAVRYRVERSVAGPADGFVVVSEDGDETVAAGNAAAAMYVDAALPAGATAAWYRVTGWSPAGYGNASEAVQLL